MLTIICAWCRQRMGEVESLAEGVTHGCCPNCQKLFAEEIATESDRAAASDESPERKDDQGAP